jgi:hypothetical protein
MTRNVCLAFSRDWYSSNSAMICRIMLLIGSSLASRLAALIRNGEIAVRLPAGRDPQVEGGANRCGHDVLPPSIACREQLVEQIAEPSLEHVNLGLGHGHVLPPVIGHRPLDRIDLPRSPRAASRSTHIVVQIVRSCGRWGRALSPRFLEASQGASVAPVAIPQNDRSPRHPTPVSPLPSPRERPRSREAMIAWRQRAGQLQAGQGRQPAEPGARSASLDGFAAGRQRLAPSDHGSARPTRCKNQ